MRELIEVMYLDIMRGTTNETARRLGDTGVVLDGDINHEEFVKLQELTDWYIEKSLRELNWKTLQGRRVFNFGRKG